MRFGTSRWIWILPAVALALTLSFSSWGAWQTSRHHSPESTYWDYLAPAEIILHSVNWPAAVGASLVTGKRNLQIGWEYSKISYAAYLGMVELLWLVIGFLLDKGIPRSDSRLSRPFALVAIGIGITLLLFAIGMTKGPYATLLTF